MRLGPWISAGATLAGSLADARDKEREIRRREQQDEEDSLDRRIRRAALMANMEDSGIVGDDDRETIKADLPDVGTIQDPARKPPVTLDTLVSDPKRYSSLGDTGYSLDRTRTKDARRIADERKRETTLRQRIAALKALDPEAKTLSLEELLGIAGSDEAFNARIRGTRPSQSSSFTERNTREIQDRIDELTAQGVPLGEANRQARLEAGSSAPRLEDRIGAGPSESPVVRDNRRAADRDRSAMTDTRREITALKRELGQYPADTPENRARKARLRTLEQRRDSLQTEFDTHASTANRAALGGAGGEQSSALQRALGEARQAYEQALKQGMDSTTAQQKYRELVAALRDRYRDE